MKKIVLTITLTLISCIIYAQENESELQKLAKRNQVNRIISKRDSLYAEKIFKNYEYDRTKLGDDRNFNNGILNKYFKEIITSYASNTSDLSFSNYFINANTSEKTLTIGKSFRLDNLLATKEKRKAVKVIRPIQKVENLLSVYVKSNLSNGFSNLISENSKTNEFEFNSNIGVGLKYTRVLNGKIKLSDKGKEKIKYIRDHYVKKELKSLVKKYDKEAFEKDVILSDFENRDSIQKLKKAEKKQVEKKYFEFYEALIDSELKYIKSEKLISSSSVWWLSGEAYIPLTNRIVKHSIDSVSVIDKEFKDYSFTGAVNYLRSGSSSGLFKDTSVKLTLQPSVFRTNNFKINNQSTATFQSIIKDNTSTVVEGAAKSVFLGDYDDFWAKSLKSELVFLVFNNSIGLSGAVEFVDSDIKDYTNWKLGVPFSLKDKEGKPTVNFELQWKEVSSAHFVGISVGYNFGRFVK